MHWCYFSSLWTPRKDARPTEMMMMIPMEVMFLLKFLYCAIALAVHVVHVLSWKSTKSVVQPIYYCSKVYEVGKIGHKHNKLGHKPQAFSGSKILNPTLSFSFYLILIHLTTGGTVRATSKQGTFGAEYRAKVCIWWPTANTIRRSQ